jgi:uroporphyrinogen-III synthase
MHRAFDTDVAQAQALLFTSAAGVRAFASASADRERLVLAVGDASADTARRLGFAAVRSADGDAAALAALVQSALDPRAGALIHFSGADHAGDVVGGLVKAGFEAERRIAYEARAATLLPEALNQALDIVLFHSARAAETFVKLAPSDAHRLTAACLSQAVADAAARVPWARLMVAPRPHEDALLDAALGPENSPAGASA